MKTAHLVNGVDSFEDAAGGPLEVAHFHRVVDAVGLEIIGIHRDGVSGAGRHRETIHVAQGALAAGGAEAGRPARALRQNRINIKVQRIDGTVDTPRTRSAVCCWPPLFLKNEVVKEKKETDARLSLSAFPRNSNRCYFVFLDLRCTTVTEKEED